MASRHHNDCIRFLTAVMLTVAVMTSPLRPSHWALGSSHSPKLARNFAIPKSRAARLSANLTALRLVRIKALPSDSQEEKLASAVRPSGWQLVLPVPTSPISCGDSAVSLLDRAPHPLRC